MRSNRTSVGRQILILVGGLLALSCHCLAGCAFVDAHLKPDYQPLASQCPRPGQAVLLSSVNDERMNRPRIGVKKNGYGWETAGVFLVHPGGAAGWVREALAAELEKSGFKLADNAAMVKHMVISTTLRELFVDVEMKMFSPQMHALILLEVDVVFPDGRRFRRLFKGYQQDSMSLGLESEYVSVLLKAANEVFGKVMDRVCDLMIRGSP